MQLSLSNAAYGSKFTRRLSLTGKQDTSKNVTVYSIKKETDDLKSNKNEALLGFDTLACFEHFSHKYSAIASKDGHDQVWQVRLK